MLMRRRQGYQSHQRRGQPWSSIGRAFRKQSLIRSAGIKQEALATFPPERERAPSQGLVILYHLHCFQQNGGRWSWTALSSIPVRSCGEEECCQQ
jgi:hypothetical protein